MTARRLLALVAWTLLVLVCSTGVWGVIRTAGTGVTTSPEVPSTIIDATSPAAPSPGTTAASSRPRTRAAHPKATSPPPSPTPVLPAPSRQPADGAGDRTGTTETDGTRAPTSPEPSEVRRTWQGAAGAVIASCRGTTVGLRGAQPNSGWRVEVGDRGPEQIEVNFASNEGEDEGEVELKARCVGGEPRFSTSGD